MAFDLLSTVEQGGCSAKLSPKQLGEILNKLPKSDNPNIMVDIDTHDDAGVYKINDETALIYTTDFFPPVCSDPLEFGEVAAANALSDVYAMGGTPIMALNLMMFSANKLPMDAYVAIMQGGHNKVTEAGAVILGGHTIDDHPPKYGLAVVGTVHPDKLVTNANVEPGDNLVLTKPLGIGVALAAHKLKMASDDLLKQAVDQMKLLNKTGAEIMQRYHVKAATDITGFGLLGHSMKMAEASNVSININANALPFFEGIDELLEDGCIPGAAFRNLDFIQDEVEFDEQTDYNMKMLACDAQTSGGLLIAVKPEYTEDLLMDLLDSGLHPQARIIGQAVERKAKSIYFK
ncbi:selenide, water dikinase SelD [Puteibacter caeruleilacunae]|nr:selenide, water dikinase SelD [Puteibacter caeruleilacunae]